MTITAPVQGGLVDPQWAQDVTDAVNTLNAAATPVVRKGSTVRTANVGTFTTTETTTDSVTVALVSGRTYGVWLFTQVQSTVAADSATVRIKEDSSAGNQLAVQRVKMADSGAAFGAAMYVEYTAVATGNKTFVGTMLRSVGTGNLTAVASANQQSVIYVDQLN